MIDDTPSPTESHDRYKLMERLENVVAQLKIEGRRVTHFVDEKSICGTCRNAQIMRRGSKNHLHVHCSSLGQFMPTDIVECNSYRSITELSLGQMTDIATIIDSTKQKRVGIYP